MALRARSTGVTKGERSTLAKFTTVVASQTAGGIVERSGTTSDIDDLLGQCSAVTIPLPKLVQGSLEALTILLCLVANPVQNTAPVVLLTYCNYFRPDAALAHSIGLTTSDFPIGESETPASFMMRYYQKFRGPPNESVLALIGDDDPPTACSLSIATCMLMLICAKQQSGPTARTYIRRRLTAFARSFHFLCPEITHLDGLTDQSFIDDVSEMAMKQCRNTWPTNSQWILGTIWQRCVEPGVGTSPSFLKCTSTACHWSVPYRTTTVCTRHPPRALHPFQPSQEKIDPSCNFWQGTCSVDLMPRVKACHGTTCDSTYQSLRFCFNQPEVAGSGSRLGPNMFAVPLKPAFGPVNLNSHSDSPDSAVGQVEANEVVLVDSPRSDASSSFSVVHPIPRAPREHRTESAEAKAKRILEAPDGPSKAQLLELFDSLPRSLYRRTDGGDGVPPTSFVVGGVNPRSSSLPLHLCSSHPYFVRAVTRYIKEACPSHKYSTFVIRRGCSGRIHRDCKNGPCPSLVVGLNDQLEGEGLWIHDKVGTCMKRHLDQDLWGTVVPIQAPFVFDARKTLHAGHLSDTSLAPLRGSVGGFYHSQC